MATKLGFAALAILLFVLHSGYGLSIDTTQGSPAESTKAMVTPAAPAEDEKVSIAPLLLFIGRYIMSHFPGYVASHPCIQRIADDCGWMVSYQCAKKAISKCS